MQFLRVLILPLVLSNLPAFNSPTAPIPAPQPTNDPIVIGFMGGRVGRDNAVHYEVQLANRLRREFPRGLQVRIFENRRGFEAYQEVLRLVPPDRKNSAHIAIYGHSWGASEGITLARTLARDHIPVLLTVQVDSVQKLGQDDGWIPTNVAQAVNFYQLDGLLHGRPLIRASDASHTQILGNFQFMYKTRTANVVGFPWFARAFMRPHIEIEADPALWGQVESLIRTKLQLSSAG